MAARRQQQWEGQLKEKAFLIATIKPIEDEAVGYHYHREPQGYKSGVMDGGVRSSDRRRCWVVNCGDLRSHQNALFYLRTKEVAMVASRLAECVRRGPAAGACGVRF